MNVTYFAHANVSINLSTEYSYVKKINVLPYSSI